MTNISRFVWHDLSSSDVEGAKRFYGELFDWTFEGEPYVHVKAGDQMIGGIRPREAHEQGPPCWLGYVLVEDVQQTVDRAKAANGQVYMPATEMPDVGTFAVMADPSGGVLAPWRSAHEKDNEESDAPPANHTFCWSELLSTDPAAATSFYCDVFGWEPEVQDMGPMGDYTLLGRPGTQNPMQPGKPAWAGGLYKAPDGVPQTFWLPYVQVEDADASAERARNLGAKLMAPPMDIPGIGRFFTFTDPESAVLACISFPKP